MNLRLGIKNSCDCYFYQVALKLGIDALAAGAKRLGLGQPTGIEIPGERGGFIPDRYWKQATFREAWQQGDSVVAGIGQGYILATPLQLCMLAARIASGMQVSPRIVRTLGTQMQPRPEAEPVGFSPAALAAVRDAMNATANEPGGTAYAWRITDKSMAMAGKTGTAQVRVITKAERAGGVRRNEGLPWALRDHGLFIGYAPVDKPRYACAVVIEHGGVGAHPQVAGGARCSGLCAIAQYSRASARLSDHFGRRRTMSVFARSFDGGGQSLPLSQKLSRIDWVLVALITLIACAGFHDAVFGGRRGTFSPWAGKQMVRFVIAFAIFLAVACVDLRIWMGLAYPAYGASLVLLIAVEAAGRVGLGAQRWIELGPVAIAAIGVDEDRAHSGACPLSAWASTG